jgi:hypothetical protein
MRLFRRFAFLPLVLLLVPAAASAGERSRREILPQVDTVQILEMLTRPWRLLWQPEMAPNKILGLIDPSDIPIPGCTCLTPDLCEGGGTMDPNG